MTRPELCNNASLTLKWARTEIVRAPPFGIIQGLEEEVSSGRSQHHRQGGQDVGGAVKL